MNQIVFEIFKWYRKNSRNLPWRNTRNPYKIWLSEIILQQTQIIQGRAYYEKFVDNFPNINALANAPEDRIMKLWQGLGYYSRARNLHKAAIIVRDRFKGKFPENHAEILKLPGVGAYTAAAIASFAYDAPYPALDGNVFRFLSRLFDIDAPIDESKNRTIFMNILQEMMQGQDPATFNNAMMEMGAMVCTPARPDCANCCVAAWCEAKKQNTIALRPVKVKKVAVRRRYFNFIFIEYNGGFYVQKRTGKDIWKNLYQLPLIESIGPLNEKSIAGELQSLIKGKTLLKPVFDKSVRHQLTHQTIEASFWKVHTDTPPDFQNDDIILTNPVKFKKLALPQLIANYLLHL